ncbi:uncharacterized protein LOC129605650 [Condylostylus longicornis]|uniref:uncharacterized protein LOC129605650 n=1 Tax=Condylostylus longicornis TaxID=2530218 RepID=UPI00244E03A0|nr:uncharacterized protein LOC129605650 [Condylostylus longicornis]
MQYYFGIFGNFLNHDLILGFILKRSNSPNMLRKRQITDQLTNKIPVVQLAEILIKNIMGGQQSQPEFKTILTEERKEQKRENDMIREQVSAIEKQLKEQNENEKELLNQWKQEMDEKSKSQRQKIKEEFERLDQNNTEHNAHVKRKFELEKAHLCEEKKLMERSIENEVEKLQKKKEGLEEQLMETQNEIEERSKIENKILNENILELDTEIQKAKSSLKQQEEKLQKDNLKNQELLTKRFETELSILTERGKIYEKSYENKIKQLEVKRNQMDKQYEEDKAEMIERQNYIEKRNELKIRTLFEILAKQSCIQKNPNATYNIAYKTNTPALKEEFPSTSISIPKEIAYNENVGAIEDTEVVDWKVALNNLPVPIADENFRELGEKILKLNENQKEELNNEIHELLEKCGLTANDPDAKVIAIRVTQTFLKKLQNSSNNKCVYVFLFLSTIGRRMMPGIKKENKCLENDAESCIKVEPLDDSQSALLSTNDSENFEKTNLANSGSILNDALEGSDNEFTKNTINYKKSNHKGKIYYSIRMQKFLLICSGCNSKFYDSKKFLLHICDAEIIAQARKSLEESIVADTATLKLGDDNLWHCRICDKTFDRKNTLRKHEQAHVMNYPCEICTKIFKSPSNLREHMNTHTGERPFKCHLCEAAFTRKWALTSHVRGHLGDKRYPCNYCEKKFLKGPQLKVHIRMVHTKEKPCQCELCGAHFYSTTLLNEHKKRHGNIRNYKCEQCGKSFYDKKQLTKHYISHSDERPFKCKICDMAFQREGTLKAHTKVHTGVKDYICQLCGRGFAENYNLTKHLRSHANGKIKIKDPNNVDLPKEPKKKGRKPKNIREEEEQEQEQEEDEEIQQDHDDETWSQSEMQHIQQRPIVINVEHGIKPIKVTDNKTCFIITQSDSAALNSITNNVETNESVVNPVSHPVFGNTNMLNIPNLFLQIPHLPN